jgi:DNA-binding transcriptional ArsR family regulator
MQSASKPDPYKSNLSNKGGAPSKQSPQVKEGQLEERLFKESSFKEGPSIAAIAAVIGDPARANMLTALLGGAALTASELALEAGITKQTASSHLGKLTDANLVALEAQGRHRYFRLADRDVADLLESLMGVAARVRPSRTRPGPKEPALRRARVCYDHLAGDLGVALYDGLIESGLLEAKAELVFPTRRGEQKLTQFGLDLTALKSQKRPLCRACLDWSVRRSHLAGSLGAALLARMIELGWAKRQRGSRVIAFTARGETALRKTFALH